MSFRVCKQAFKNYKQTPGFRQFCSSVPKKLVDVLKEDNIYFIGINRPQKRNCVNSETALQLRNAFESFSDDSDASIAVLYGKGGTFCAGYDLEEVSSGDAEKLPMDHGPMGPTRMFLKKPVIAAVDGYAVAGGLELALWCDLRVIEETAVLGVFCRRFGVPLIDGGTVRLPKLVGLARAMDLILTGRGISGKEAYDIGLATKLCKKNEALKVAVEVAKDLCKVPQEGLLADKNSVKVSTFDASCLNEALDLEAKNGASAFVSAAKNAANFHEDLHRLGTHVPNVKFESN